MEYLHWDRKTITDFSEKSVTLMYQKGYVFTRLGKGIMDQTRSVRINLSKFHLSSENRRILKKVPDIGIETINLPMKGYSWSIGKMGKDFYQLKFGQRIMSAQKIKEVVSDGTKSNFNTLLKYSLGKPTESISSDTESSLLSDSSFSDTFASSERSDSILPVGFSIAYSNSEILHYSYPFYDLHSAPKDIGLAMMIKSIQYAKENNLKYVYLGSLQRPSDTYKLQFEGLEWFDGKGWRQDLGEVKKILKK